MSALVDDDVVEIMLNCDSTLWVEKHGVMSQIGEINVNDASAILMTVSSALKHELTKETPIISGELPLDGSRFQGMFPPVVDRPVFTIRKKAIKVYTLMNYIQSGIIGFIEAEYLRAAIKNYQNIMVIGGTGSGKTTFCNALLNEIYLLTPHDRMIIIEDTQELQCNMANRVFMRESAWTPTMQLAQSTQRMRPTRITVGEIRKGAPALELLKLWNTGHPGGMGTAHANSAAQGLSRIDQLIQEVTTLPQRELIAEAVNICVFLKKTGDVRRVEEIVEVTGYNHKQNRFISKDVFRLHPKKEFLCE
jgi:type IV secretion system protein VirB11